MICDISTCWTTVGSCWLGGGAWWVWNHSLKFGMRGTCDSCFTLPWRPRGGVEVQLYSFFSLGARWLWVDKDTASHCTGGWVGRRAGLDGCGKPRPIGNLFYSLVLSLYVVRTPFCFLIVLHFFFSLYNKHPFPRRDSNPQSQQAIGRRPSP